MKKIITRYLLLQKRLIRKKSYLLMILSVFLFVLILRGVAMQDSSMVKVSIAYDGAGEPDEIAASVYDGFENAGVVLSFDKYDTKEDAIKAVASGKADEAWIIPCNLSEIIVKFADKTKISEPIEIYAREKSVIQFFLRELLQAKLYRYISEEIYNHFVTENIGEVKADFSAHVPVQNVFKLYDMAEGEPQEQPDYVTAPLRGLIALWLLISAIASAMYYIYDKKNGLFIYWRTKHDGLREFMYLFVIAFDSSIIALFAIYLAGIFTNIFTEISVIFIYDIILTLFAMLLIRIMRSETVIGIFTPVIVTVSSVFSPVFFELRAFEVICRLVPPYHYLKNIVDFYYLKGMLIYTGILLILVIGIDTLFINAKKK